MRRAIKSVKLYPLPVTTEAEACALEGVGRFTARRMLLGLATTSAAAVNGGVDSRGPPGGARAPARRADDEENIGPLSSSSSSRGGGKSKRDGVVLASQPRTQQLQASYSSSAGLRDDEALSAEAHVGGRRRNATSERPFLSLASNLSALRGGAQTPDVTPKRPTSRARTEGGDGVGVGFSTRAPRFFSGSWQAMLIVDNREHAFLAMQVGSVIGIIRRRPVAYQFARNVT